jgi:hypothetical protein
MNDQTNEQRTNRGKYITLVVLIIWVVGVFVFSLLKFSKTIS